MLPGEHNRSPRPFFSPHLRSGEMINVANMGRIGTRRGQYVQNPDRLAFVSGWRALESTGTWMLDDTAKMRVQTDCEPGQALLVLLHVGTSPWVGRHNTLRIESLSAATGPAGPDRQDGYRRPMRPNEDLWLTIIGQIDDLGCLPIQFKVTGPILPTDPGAIAVGLSFREFSYTLAIDTTARVAMLERAFLSPASALLQSQHAHRD